MNPLEASLINLARAYLTHSPVTEGKRRLYEIVRRHYVAHDPYMTFPTKHGFQLRGNLTNPDHLYYYFFGEEDERYEIRAVKRIVRGGDTVWDIGTNIGFYTCLFAKLAGATGRVIAFEPSHLTFEKMSENISLNQLVNVVPLNLGVSRSPATLKLYYEAAGMFEGRSSVALPSSSGLFESVQVDSIDNLLATLPPPDFIKIDVEGHQLDVIEGGRRFLSRHAPIILAELKHPDPKMMESADALLKELGFALFKMGKHHVWDVPSLMESRSRNLLAVKKASAAFDRIRPLLK